ncbi:hypothetical protein HMPREF0262_01147 [Clostridium sp. ATCC 29733]|nr:hypothetical protein HMPREF0262_01147 [Clostridium sp. ATCC 29733]
MCWGKVLFRAKGRRTGKWEKKSAGTGKTALFRRSLFCGGSAI